MTQRLAFWMPLNWLAMASLFWLSYPNLPQPNHAEYWLVLAWLALVATATASTLTVAQLVSAYRHRISDYAQAARTSHLTTERLRKAQANGVLAGQRIGATSEAMIEQSQWIAEDIAQLQHATDPQALQNYSQQLKKIAELEAQPTPPPAEDIWLDQQLVAVSEHSQLNLMLADRDICVHLPPPWCQQIIEAITEAAVQYSYTKELQVIRHQHSELNEVVRFTISAPLTVTGEALRRALRHRGEGVGWKLAIARRYVERLGGVVSHEPEGLVLLLPLRSNQ